MKTVRNFLFASYLNARVSMQLHPIISATIGAVSVAFVYSIAKIFGL